MRTWSWFLVLPILVTACGIDTSVSLEATLPEAQVNVQDGALGASLSGSFRLELSLGGEASGATKVNIANFSLQNEAGAPLVEVLKVETASPLPVQVGKGETASVSFTFEETGVDHDALCAGKVRIVGSVMDSLKGASDPVQSALFTPNCDAT